MGIDIQTWRSRIGSHNACFKFLTLRANGGCLYFPLGFFVLSILTIHAILSIGGVETNPGPKLQCLVCFSQPLFGTINEHVLHQKSHALDKHFQFSCPVCSFQFGSFNALDLHVRYFHNESRNLPQDEFSLHACNVAICDNIFPSTKLLCQHLKKDHLKKGEKILCPFSEKCKSKNQFSESTFGVHLSQKHSGWNLTSSTLKTAQPFNSPPHANFENSEDHSDENMDTHDGGVAAGNDLDNTVEDTFQVDPQEEKLIQWKEEFYRHLAMLYLRLESLHLVPISTINVIAKSLAELTATNLRIVREAILREFEDVDLSEDVKERKVNSILSADALFAAHHKDVSGPTMTTNALRKSYYISHFAYVKPKEINMSQDPNNPRCVYYCKIKNTLNLLLRDPKVQKKVQASFTRESKADIFEDYQDGSLHKKRKLNHPENSIDLHIFTDEFTPTKDLSSVANKYKILGMYYTIGNLPSHIRAKLDCKRLIMLVPDSKSMFSDFKLGLFKVVVKELMKLQREGITFMGENVKVRLRFLLGDNKGQHEIGGFIQSFSSEYFCRYCSMSKTEINAEPWKVGPMRTPESIEEYSQLVPADRATYKGVARPEWSCPFNKLEDFHVGDPSLMPCIGHDLYLGVINYDLALILQYFVVKKKWFTYIQLNHLIRTFKFNGKDSGNRPAPVKFEKSKNTVKEKKEPTLGGHAVQNWTLLRLLPFILDKDFIKDCNDSYWRLYLSLKELTENLVVPSTTVNHLGRLKVMLENYMAERQTLLGNGKPKHHLAAHGADLMSLVGPLVHFSGLGFEQFHQFFKNAAKAGKNFIDLGHSLIKKYCLYLSYLSASSPFVTGFKVSDPGVTVSAQREFQFDEEFEAALQSKSISNEALILNKIELDGLLFKKEQWILLSNLSDSVIEAGMITTVILDGNSLFFMMKKHTATYLSDYGIYVINDNSSGLACISREEVKYPLPHSIYQWGEYDKCFSLKHSLINTHLH